MSEQLNISEGKAQFTANVWVNGNSKVITIPKHIADYLSIEKSDVLKVRIKVLESD